MKSPQINSLETLLKEKADPNLKKWWEAYVKNSAPFRGVKMPDIRSALHQWYRAENIDKFTKDTQFDLALNLFGEVYTEDKLAAILFLQEILLPAGAIQCERQLHHFADLFDSGKIYDWNLCDWFCVKVLGPLIKRDGNVCAETIATWHESENLWRARASVVAFVNLADRREYYSLHEASCCALIMRNQRFAKTAVGWILRDISKHDESFVKSFIEQYIQYFSIESLNNAAKYFSAELRIKYRKLLKQQQHESALK